MALFSVVLSAPITASEVDGCCPAVFGPLPSVVAHPAAAVDVTASADFDDSFPVTSLPESTTTTASAASPSRVSAMPTAALVAAWALPPTEVGSPDVAAARVAGLGGMKSANSLSSNLV